MSAYTGPDDQEEMRKTDFRPESNPGLMTSKPAHQTLPLDHLGLCMLTSKLKTRSLVMHLQYCFVQYHFPKLAELANEMDDYPMEDEPKCNIYALNMYTVMYSFNHAL